MEPSQEPPSHVFEGSRTEAQSARGSRRFSMAVASSLASRAPFVSNARARGETSSEAASAVVLAEGSSRVPPFVVAAEAEGSDALLSWNFGGAATPASTTGVQSQLEATSQACGGRDRSRVSLAAGSALSDARSLLMTPGATRTAFETLTCATLAPGRHTHWRSAVDAGDGWLCSNCNRLAVATRCEMCGASRSELSGYSTPGELASVMADASASAYGRGLRFLEYSGMW